MKIFLDECVTKRLKIHLQEFEVFTVRELNPAQANSEVDVSMSCQTFASAILPAGKLMGGY